MSKVTEESKRLRALRRLCGLHPEDADAHVRLGECLLDHGREIAAVLAFRKAWRLLKDENPMAAGELVRKHGEEVSCHELRPMASGDYLPLAGFFGGLAARRRRVRLAEGASLFHRGDAAENVFLVLDGELAVLADWRKGEPPVLINYLHRGALVGEGALTNAAVRSASVVANQPSLLLRFTPEEFEAAASNYPALRLQFSKEGMLRRRVALLSSSELFARLPMDLRFLIARRAWLAGFSAGETIKPSGQALTYAALVARGAVRLCDRGGVYCGRAPSGMMLAPGALMHAEVASLALVADESCELVCMEDTVVRDVMHASVWFQRQLTDLTRRFSDHVAETIVLRGHV